MRERNTWLELLYQQNRHLRDGLLHDEIENKISQIRSKEIVEKSRGHFTELQSLLLQLVDDYQSALDSLEIIYTQNSDCIDIFPQKTLLYSKNIALASLIKNILIELSPWRKGPFNFFGTQIDAEWNSHLKWERLQNLYDITELCKDKTILDVGCSNGYYSLLMELHQAKWILGIDPMPRNSFFFELYRILFPNISLYYEMMGVQDCTIFDSCFDTIFCMGILYHQRNPLGMLEVLRNTLNKRGVLVLETICLNNNEPYCLIPSDRYLKAKGYWFIPSVEVIRSWLQKSGFEVLAHDTPVKTSFQEQKYTSWIRGQSLEDFLDHDNDELTVEGYPAPYRVIFIAKKRTT